MPSSLHKSLGAFCPVCAFPVRALAVLGAVGDRFAGAGHQWLAAFLGILHREAAALCAASCPRLQAACTQNQTSAF